MKTVIFVCNSLGAEKNVGVEVGIVTGHHNNSHAFEYQVFPLKKPINNVGLIGVDNRDQFAISFKPNFIGRFALAVYLDGVNVSQKNGIKSLNEINEANRSSYSSHKGVFICENQRGSIAYLNRFSQKNEENRLFTFTTDFKTGLNELLISDPSLSNKIEVYIWKEKVLHDDFCSYYQSVTRSDIRTIKVGAGKPTYDKYKTSLGLSNPIYLGKAMFIHLHSQNVKHLGQTIIAAGTPNNSSAYDPMDIIPKT